MFARRYFALRFFAARYFPPVQDEGEPPAGGGGFDNLIAIFRRRHFR